MSKSIKTKAHVFEAGNNEASAIILSDPERWGGAQAGLVQWANLHASHNSLVNVYLSPQVDRKEQVDGNHAEKKSTQHGAQQALPFDSGIPV